LDSCTDLSLRVPTETGKVAWDRNHKCHFIDVYGYDRSLTDRCQDFVFLTIWSLFQAIVLAMKPGIEKIDAPLSIRNATGSLASLSPCNRAAYFLALYLLSLKQ